MENYILLKSEDAIINEPFPSDYTSDAIRFEIIKNTKVRSLIVNVAEQFKKGKTRKVLLSSVGNCCAKCVSCAEILKTKFDCLYQWTELSSLKSIDVWIPNVSADQRLDQLTVEKYVPKIFILLSLDPFPEKLHCLGQQNSKERSPSFLNRSNQSNSKSFTKPINSNNDGSLTEQTHTNKWKRPQKNDKKINKKSSKNNNNNLQNDKK